MNTVLRTTPEDKIRLITRAGDYEREMREAKTIEHACDLVTTRHNGVRQKGRELIESIFWMGGAISKAHSLSEWGDRFFENLEGELMISQSALRRALRAWDLFDGNIVQLYNWYTLHFQENGKVLISDLENIIKDNRDVIDSRQHLRRVEGQIEKQEIPELVVKKSGLREALRRRRASLKTTQMTKPATLRLPPFKRLRTLKQAKQKLVFEPEAPGVPIEEVRLSDGKVYDLVVSLKEKQTT